jgi:hypothetical protein
LAVAISVTMAQRGPHRDQSQRRATTCVREQNREAPARQHCSEANSTVHEETSKIGPSARAYSRSARRRRPSATDVSAPRAAKFPDRPRAACSVSVGHADVLRCAGRDGTLDVKQRVNALHRLQCMGVITGAFFPHRALAEISASSKN